MVTVFGTAITLGFFVELPVWDFSREKQEAAQNKAEEEAVREALKAENRLSILNSMIDGNPDSEKLKEILEQLKKDKYGEQIEVVELKVETQKALADEHGVDLEEFAGQLDFYADGEKLGSLIGETDPFVVEQTIDRYLAGLVKRYGPNWLPKVPGMARAGSAVPAVAQPQAKPTGVPGMQRAPSGVPGMTRAQPGQTNLKVEPADSPKK